MPMAWLDFYQIGEARILLLKDLTGNRGQKYWILTRSEH
jgi:hypothetical protein